MAGGRRVLAAVTVGLMVGVGLAGTAAADPAHRYTPVFFQHVGYDYGPRAIWDGRQWTMYDCGLITNPDGYNSDAIYRSTSTDGVHWSGAAAVLSVGPEGSWDDRHVCDPSVLAGVNVGGFEWAMWYTGVGDRGADTIGPNAIGLALSHDGITWQKQGVAVDCNAGTDVYGCLQPSVVQVGSTFYMSHSEILCGDDSCRLNRVETSTDGKTWQKGDTFSLPQAVVGPDLMYGADGAWYAAAGGNSTCGRAPGQIASEVNVYRALTLTAFGSTIAPLGCVGSHEMDGGRYVAEPGFFRDALGHQIPGTNELWVGFGLATGQPHNFDEDIRIGRFALSGDAGGLVHRIAGDDRVGTAVALSQRVFVRAGTVVLARSDGYADALAGAPLAGTVGGPVLLTPHDHLADTTRAELARLETNRVYLLGGTGALSDQVVAELHAAGIGDVVRIGGVDRFDTARLVARRVGGKYVFVAEGDNPDPKRGWPDAVAVSALAAHDRHPILLVEQNRLPDATAGALADLGVNQATVVGGTASISTTVTSALTQRGIAVNRLAGADRFATSRAVASLSMTAAMSHSVTWLTTGWDWPDSLVAGPAVAAYRGILLLADGVDLNGSPTTRDWLAQWQPVTVSAHLVGGTAALSTAVENEVRSILGAPSG